MTEFTLSDKYKDALLEGGVLVFDHLIGEDATAACLRTLEAVTDKLEDGRVGDSGRTRIDKDVRGDRVRFIPPDRVPPGMDRLWAWFRAMPRALFGALAPRVETEYQIALYPGGGSHYIRHFDLRGPADDRRATAVWYPNTGWKPEHGGIFRAHTASGVVDIEPKADRAILFLASLVAHEVLPAHQPRWAISAFYSIPKSKPPAS